jgi:hypothetical protein
MPCTIFLSGGVMLGVQRDAERVARDVVDQDGGYVFYPGADDGRDVYVFVDHVVAIRAQ